jgi:hypothetical protein
MKEPFPRCHPIDQKRIDNWKMEFEGYRYNVSEYRIHNWLKQFQSEDYDLASRVLDCVDYISQSQISTAFKTMLDTLPGWDRKESNRRGKWRFVPFSISAGESGDSMLHTFRLANNLDGARYKELFVNMRDLLAEDLRSEDTVVFVDDLAGTGDSVCDAWTRDMAELLPNDPKMYLILIAASGKASKEISSKTSLCLAPSFQLEKSDNIFSDQCQHFNEQEKQKLEGYCKKANKKIPKGYGECGFVIVFAHRCPNNTIPILHANHPEWTGLFRRHN